jgi:gluconate kinase
MAKWPSSRRHLGQEEHPRALHQLYSKRLREKISQRKRHYMKNKWITHVLPILTPKEIQEYVSLWEADRYS